MNNNKPVIVYGVDMTTISLQCNAGVLHADIETRDRTPNNAIYIRFTPLGVEESIDIACVRDIDNSLNLDVKLWIDPSSEDPTLETVMRREDVERAMSDN